MAILPVHVPAGEPLSDPGPIQPVNGLEMGMIAADVDSESPDDIPLIDPQPITDSAPLIAADSDDTDERRLDSLEAEIRALKQEVRGQRPKTTEKSENRIELGGAIRFQYSLEDYNAGNRDRGGDLDFDIFRLDLNGQLGGVQMSAQYRWFQYMNVIHHAWVGTTHSDLWQFQAGITRVPFGNLPFNSHNFFFSSNFYVGLEDDYDAGIKLIGQDACHDLRLAYFLTDEMGGIDGFVDNRADRYSYDLVGVREPNEGLFDPPSNQVAEYHTGVIRYVYKYPYADVGGSLLYGDTRNFTSSVGNRFAYAAHVNSTIDRWNLQLQYTDYDYNTDGGAGLLVVGAYSFFDTIPARAQLYTCNLAYTLPVKIGAISQLMFYNDYNLMPNKSGGLKEDTIMNVTGVALTAGGLYTYFDLITAKNQPFVGSSMASDDDDWNTRFNINVGFYF